MHLSERPAAPSNQKLLNESKVIKDGGGLEWSNFTLDGSFEKGFTGLARGNAVMETRSNIAADEAKPFGSVFVFKIITLREIKYVI